MKSLHRTLQLLLAVSLLFCSQAFAQDISRPSDVLKGISEDVTKELRLHRPQDPFPKAAMDKADQQMEAYCQGKTGIFTFIVSEVDEKSSDKGSILISAKETSERLFGKSVAVVQGVVLDASQKPQVAKIKKGTRITATGAPWAVLSWRTDHYELSFWLDKASLK